jgi:hypothetical protein
MTFWEIRLNYILNNFYFIFDIITYQKLVCYVNISELKIRFYIYLFKGFQNKVIFSFKIKKGKINYLKKE